jgi:hypothetical protein
MENEKRVQLLVFSFLTYTKSAVDLDSPSAELHMPFRCKEDRPELPAQ